MSEIETRLIFDPCTRYGFGGHLLFLRFYKNPQGFSLDLESVHKNGLKTTKKHIYIIKQG